MKTTNKLHIEINSFKEMWDGGYRTGYSPKRNQKALEDYLTSTLKGKTLLEIGCGGGNGVNSYMIKMYLRKYIVWMYCLRSIISLELCR